MTQPLVLLEPIPPQTVLEGSILPELDCNNYFVSLDDQVGEIQFSAELANNQPLPKGLLCSENGLLAGIPEVGAHGQYIVKITAKNALGTLDTQFNLTILEQQAVKSGEPILIKTIPNIVVNEGAALGPIDLTQYIRASDPAKETVRFMAELSNGRALPKGIICTSNGILSGIPASGTIGQHEVVLSVENTVNGAKRELQFTLSIKERIEIGGESQFYTGLKSQVWDALGRNQPVPEFAELFNHPLTAVEIYYLMQRFATLTIYDVYNLDPPGSPVLLTLPGASPHYNIYDRGSCLVGAPKELFSHERTLEDALITAKVMSREVYKRNWTIELVGFQKMMRASWIEFQILGEKNANFLDVLHYTPSANDLKLYEKELKSHLTLGQQRSVD